eukprot:CAMPEP_0113957600 /NCGR_PEP_ID=MMETSP0011_2-20120614/2870_1 /TAXON_ID=101924 /ORGANISM="Rhodosorus marinus" /LENGTH=1001 /DNA_ID=CAMNT_0000968201 /DNA_START=516 /DNA_END=3521 /DNA_ORIENTATION=- /assembly_acc=CAM_ASM_000156
MADNSAMDILKGVQRLNLDLDADPEPKLKAKSAGAFLGSESREFEQDREEGIVGASAEVLYGRSDGEGQRGTNVDFHDAVGMSGSSAFGNSRPSSQLDIGDDEDDFAMENFKIIQGKLRLSSMEVLGSDQGKPPVGRSGSGLSSRRGAVTRTATTSASTTKPWTVDELSIPPSTLEFEVLPSRLLDADYGERKFSAPVGTLDLQIPDEGNAFSTHSESFVAGLEQAKAERDLSATREVDLRPPSIDELSLKIQDDDSTSRKRPSAQLDLEEEDLVFPEGVVEEPVRQSDRFDTLTNSYGKFSAAGVTDFSSYPSQLPEYSVSRKRRTTDDRVDRYGNMTVDKPINLSQLSELIYRVSTVCRAAGIQEDVDTVETDLLNCDLSVVLSSMSSQLRRVEKKNRFNAIKMQHTWYGEGSKIPDKQLFDNVSVHLRTKFNEFKPAKGLTVVLTSAGGLYNNSPMKHRWEVLDEIGRGSSGVVYRARSKVLPGEYAAVKYIDKKSADYSETKVCREVYCFHIIQRAGGHENIVEVYEVDEDDHFVYIVMELLEGEELLNRVSMAGSYMENHSAAIVSQIVEALAFVHSLNIIHRDVKAENFVFSTPARNSPIKLIDFGVSFYSHDYGSCHGTELIGSALYLAPEMWERRMYNQAVDMFSLGILVHILLTGSPPFNCMDLHDYVHRIQDEDISLDGNEWATISPLGKQFVSDILQRDPEKRITSREALEHAWLRAFDYAAPEQSSHLGSVQKTLREFSVKCSVKKGQGFLPPLSSAAEAQVAIGALKLETKKPSARSRRRTTFVDEINELDASPYMPDTPESEKLLSSDPSTAPVSDLRVPHRKTDDETEQSGGETSAAGKSSGGPQSGYLSSRSSVPVASSNGDASSASAASGSNPSSQKDSNPERSGSVRGGSFRRRRGRSTTASEASGRSGDELDKKKSSRLGELILSFKTADEGSAEPISALMLGKDSGTDGSTQETNRHTPLSSIARFFSKPWSSKSSGTRRI